MRCLSTVRGSGPFVNGSKRGSGMERAASNGPVHEPTIIINIVADISLSALDFRE